MKSLDARDRSLVFLLISMIFSLASIFTVPLAAISRIRHQSLALLGFGFLCPVIAYGTFALSLHYSKSHLYHDRLSLILDPTENPDDPLTNLEAIAKAARRHFEKLRSDIRKSLTLTHEALPLLIKLHYLQKHCINLMQSNDILATKGIDGQFPNYTELFTINVDALRGNPKNKLEMLADHIPLVTTREGKSLSFDDVCKELDLQNATS